MSIVMLMRQVFRLHLRMGAGCLWSHVIGGLEISTQLKAGKGRGVGGKGQSPEANN